MKSLGHNSMNGQMPAEIEVDNVDDDRKSEKQL
jgi:hypothetical protein